MEISRLIFLPKNTALLVQKLEGGKKLPKFVSGCYETKREVPNARAGEPANFLAAPAP